MESEHDNPISSNEQKPKKERKRKTPEEKLADAIAKKKRSDEIAKKRNAKITALKEEIQVSKWKNLLREAKTAGADEDVVISIVMEQKDTIISRAVELTNEKSNHE